jgi:hypothetical protein
MLIHEFVGLGARARALSVRLPRYATMRLAQSALEQIEAQAAGRSDPIGTEAQLDEEPDLEDRPPPRSAGESAAVAQLQPIGPGGYWQAPRRLRIQLEDGAVTPTEYGLVHYVGEANGDSWGLSTTQAALAVLFGVTPKTIQRALRRLSELGLLQHDLQPRQRAPFRVWLGPAASMDSDRVRTRLRTFEPPLMSATAADMSADTAATGQPHKSTPAEGSTADTTADSRARVRAHAKTETETERIPPYPRRGKRRRRSSEERRADRFTDELPADLAAIWDGLDDETRAAVVEGRAASTGLRWSRGSHGGGWHADVLGHHPKPIGVEAALPPDWEGRATPERYFRAWLERNSETRPV